MIPFEELSLALAAWRVKNDLPITEQDQSALEATMGVAMPAPEVADEAMAAEEVGQGDAIGDPPPAPEMDGVPPMPPTPVTEDGMSQEMQITDSQLVSADDPPPFPGDDTGASAPPPPPSGEGDDFDIDMDE